MDVSEVLFMIVNTIVGLVLLGAVPWGFAVQKKLGGIEANLEGLRGVGTRLGQVEQDVAVLKAARHDE